MEKIGLLFDSSCGYSREKIEKDGHFLVPITITIDNKEYKEGIDIDNELLFEKMREIPRPFKTSAVNINEFEEQLIRALEKYDQIIVISISKHLSNTNDNLKHFVETNEKYKNKVIVFDSELITPWIQYFYSDIIKLVKQENVKVENVIKFLEFWNNEQFGGYVAPNNLERLRIGGRLSNAQYQVAKMLKINPIIEVVQGSLDGKVIKVKKKEKIVPKMFSIIEEIYEQKIKEDPDAIIQYLYLHHGNIEMKDQMNKYADKKGILISGEVILSPSINAHVGEKVFGLGIVQYKSWEKFI